MKKITLLFTLLLSFAFNGYAQFPAPYCGPVTFDFGVEAITTVNFAGINNVTDAGSDVDHEDYTAITASVDRGNSYPITMKGFTDGNYTNYFAVFFDWNQDGDFDDANETYQIGTIVSSTGVDGVQVVGNITIPAEATPGTTRMRVVKTFAAYSTACLTTNSGFGQVEDYSVTVVVPACQAPSAGVASITSSTTATLSWTSTNTDSYVVIQAPNTGAPSTAAGTGVAVTGPSFNATNLTAMTAYEFYVRNMCSAGVYSSWAGPFLFNTTLLPGCATLPTPANGAINIPAGPITLSWTAPTTGDPVTSYDIFVGNTADNVNTFLANFTATNSGTEIVVNAYNATVFWRVAPKNVAGLNTTCAVWSFTTASPPGFCLVAEYGQYPTGALGYTPANCDGVTSNSITTAGYASEYSLVNVITGQTYIFQSSIATDFSTISNAAGSTSLTTGVASATWVSDITGQVRFYTHVDDQCGSEAVSRTRSVVCGTLSDDEPDFANISNPATATIAEGDSQVVYGQVFEAGLTDVVPNIDGQAPGITAWIGVNSADTNPATWTTWTPATHNATFVGDNDEYMASIGATLDAGTYYYASRFRLNDGSYVYGGFGDGFWNGTTSVNGVLTITPPPAPDNDNCIDATTIVVNEDFCDGTNTNGTNLGATTSGVANPICFGAGVQDVWFSFTALAGMTSVNISTDFTGGTLVDSQIALYSGSCGSLVELACDQDSGTVVLSNGLSWNSVISNAAVTPGETYYVRVSGYSNAEEGSFCLKIFGEELSAEEFSSAKISAYPNPVKSLLTVENTEMITNAAVYNLLGQLVIAKDINSTSGQLDLSALASGTYVVKIASDNKTKTLKIIKE